MLKTLKKTFFFINFNIFLLKKLYKKIKVNLGRILRRKAALEARAVAETAAAKPSEKDNALSTKKNLLENSSTINETEKPYLKVRVEVILI